MVTVTKADNGTLLSIIQRTHTHIHVHDCRGGSINTMTVKKMNGAGSK